MKWLALLLWCSTASAATTLAVDASVRDRVTQGPARVLVLLNDPAEKSGDTAAKIAAIAQLRSEVLSAIAPEHLQLRREFQTLPAFAADVDAQALEALAENPAVRSIELDLGGTGAMLEARPLAHVDTLFNAGLTGAGQTIAIVDSGITASHRDFTGRIVAEQCFCSGGGAGGCCPNGGATQSGPGSALDDNGHGTNVSGIAAGGGAIAMPGVAPAANIIAVKVLDSSNSFCCLSDVLAAFDWIAVNHPEATALNASLGTSQLLPDDCDQATGNTIATTNAIARLLQNGTLVFASAGNQRASNAMSIPACVSSAVAVGAVWDTSLASATALGCTDAPAAVTQPTCFSNSSAGTDLYGPGAFITSSGRGGGLSTYAGTSQATPMATGCATLLHATFPDASPAQIRAALQASPTQVTDPKNGRAFPLLNCSDAVTKLQSTPEVNYSAIYYAPANAGYGVAITHQDDTIGAIWYSYDPAGRPAWYTAAAPRQADGHYRGNYQRSTGTPLAAISGAPATLTTVTQGSVDLIFDTDGGLNFAFTPTGAQSQQRVLQKLPLAATALTCRFTSAPRATASNYSDLWWNASENGWGLSILHQDDRIFLAWYTYASDQQPQWLTALLQLQTDGSFRGRLNRPASGTPYTTAPVGSVTSFPVPEVGDVSLRFSDGEHATLTYSVDGVNQSKPISRLVFGTRVQICE